MCVQQKRKRQPFGFKGSSFHRAIPGFMVQVSGVARLVVDTMRHRSTWCSLASVLTCATHIQHMNRTYWCGRGVPVDDSPVDDSSPIDDKSR